MYVVRKEMVRRDGDVGRSACTIIHLIVSTSSCRHWTFYIPSPRSSGSNHLDPSCHLVPFQAS
jgi:hypothetical protein